jgi:tripartite-type tricarboxylate transporter receptor subunit TctC
VHNRAIAFTILLSSLAVSAVAADQASAADEFYAGKTVSLIVSGSGGYEGYARGVAKYMPKYIPGKPNIIVQGMPGGSGLRATNYLYNVAPRDGTVIGAIHGSMLAAPLLTPDVALFDPSKFSWLGNATADTYLGYVWHTAPVQSIEEARTKQLIVGGTSIGGHGIDTAVVAKEVFGLNLKIVSGYRSSAETKVAMERGEIHGTLGNAWSSLKLTDWFEKKLVHIILQHGDERRPELPDVPQIKDWARNDTERQILEIMRVRGEITRPYLAPPEIPADRLEILRNAFDATLRDPAFLSDMERQGLEVERPLPGKDLAVVVERVARTPPAAARLLRDTFNKYKDAR